MIGTLHLKICWDDEQVKSCDVMSRVLSAHHVKFIFCKDGVHAPDNIDFAGIQEKIVFINADDARGFEAVGGYRSGVGRM